MTDSTSASVLYEERGAVAVVTLNRPQALNSFTRAMHRDLRAVLTHGGERPLGQHLDAFVARMNEELPLLAELVEIALRDPIEADARYRDFLIPRARTAGVREDLIAALLGRAFRGMNLAGIGESIAAGRFLPSL